jgi:phosphopantetheinyl transferase
VCIVCSHPFSLSHYYDEDLLVVDEEEEAGIDMTRVRGRLVILLLDTRQTTSRCHLSLSSLVDNKHTL